MRKCFKVRRVLVPACSIRVLEGSVKQAERFPRDTLIERIEANLAELPCGVTVVAAVVTVDNMTDHLIG